MNFAAAIAISSAALGLSVAAMNWLLSRAPGWRDQRWFSLIAACSAAYALGNVATTTSAPDAVLVALSNVQVASVLVQVWAWFRYSDAVAPHPTSRAEKLLTGGYLVLAASVALPGAGFTRTIGTHTFAGSTYREAAPSAFCHALFVAAVLGAAVVGVRLFRAWRRGDRTAGVLTAALVALALLGINDAAVSAHLYPGPYLLDVGFALPVAAVAWTITSRFAADARTLHLLRGQLLAEVEARTRELAEAQEALHLAEKLAALGQFAAGVAHEVNNPASVVTTNLRYLQESYREAGERSQDATDVVADALDAMKRINELVRKLVDAGRLAAAPPTSGRASVRDAVRLAIAELQARLGDRLRIEQLVSEHLHVRGKFDVLQQVLANLLSNAVDAVPEPRAGRIRVRAERRDGRVRIVIEDDGDGMAPEVLRRAFEPFFSTKPEGRGSGLGLPVSRGLVESHGGDLWLESEPGHGTRAVVELPEAADG